MGTLNTALGKLRVKIKEQNVQYFSDIELIGIMNDQLEYFYNRLKNQECKFVSDNAEVTITSADDYTLTSFNGLIWGRVFSEYGASIPRFVEPFDEAFSYSPYGSTGITLHNHTNEEGNKISVDFWTEIPVIETDDIANDDLPWPVWDLALIRATVVECQEIRERDNSRTSIFAQEAMDDALAITTRIHGNFPRTMQGTSYV